MCLQQKKKGKSKVLSRGFCLFDSEPSRGHYDFCIFIDDLIDVLCHFSIILQP